MCQTKELTIETLAKDYQLVFGEEPDISKLQTIIDIYGFEKPNLVLAHLKINGIKPRKTGQRKNEIGLLFQLCQKWNY